MCNLSNGVISNDFEWPVTHGVTIDVLDVLCAQLTCDMFAVAKFLVINLTKFEFNSYLGKQRLKVKNI